MTVDEMNAALAPLQQTIKEAEEDGYSFVTVDPHSGHAAVPENCAAFIRFATFDLFMVAPPVAAMPEPPKPTTINGRSLSDRVSANSGTKIVYGDTPDSSEPTTGLAIVQR